MGTKLPAEQSIAMVFALRGLIRVELNLSSHEQTAECVIASFHNRLNEPITFPYVKDLLPKGRGYFTLFFDDGTVKDSGRLGDVIFTYWDFTVIEPGHAVEVIYPYKRDSSSITVGEAEFYAKPEDGVELRLWYYGKFSNLLRLPAPS